MLHLTPATVEATYELLLTTLPFRRWKLPPADDIEFRVGLSRTYRALYEREGAQHWITVSARLIDTLPELTMTMAHELVHVHLFDICPRDRDPHNKRFQNIAAHICRRHGFDPAAF